MGILNALADPAAWDAFLGEQTRRTGASRRELQALSAFVESGACLPMAEAIVKDPSVPFAPPEKKLVNKSGSAKKRTVYAFPPEETFLLKHAAWLLHRYDGSFSPACCAFRRDTGAKSAIRRLASLPGLSGLWCRKLDVHDYFNSIDVALLLPMLETLLLDDPALYAFLAALLLDGRARLPDGSVVTEPRGAMAGMPVSPFLANVYLSPVDRMFDALQVPYARYSDDILFFAPDRETLDRLTQKLLDALEALHLAVNPEKTAVFAPGEGFVFLGVRCVGGETDLSPATVSKLKAKIRRKARAIYRWKLKKHETDERAMRVFARSMTKKLFDNPRGDELTWARWFFPLLTQTAGLDELDAYLQQNMRYLATGRYGKTNYRTDYATLRARGLPNLVAAYYDGRSSSTHAPCDSSTT